MYEFYGNTFEKETFENKRLIKSVNHGSHSSAAIGNTTRYNGGQNSFTKFRRRSSENEKLAHNNMIIKNKSMYEREITI